MLNVKMQHEALKIDCGDFLCDCPEIDTKYGVDYSCKYLKQFIKPKDIEGFHPIPISNFGWQGHECWKSLLEMFSVDVKDIQEHFKSECPWTGNTYYRFYPDWLMVKELHPYRNQQHEVSDYFYDGEFFKSQFFDFQKHGTLYSQDSIAKAMMGHGYMDIIFPNDGSGDKQIVGIELTNGDMLIGHAWIWYNK